MFRLFMGFLAIICFLVPVVGCGGGGDDEAAGDRTARSQETSQSTSQQSRPMIPPKVEPPEAIIDVLVNPYFDEAGSVTELAVAPGETFTLYVFAEYAEPYHVAAAEFRFDLPAGVIITEKHPFNERVLSMGDHASDFVMGFECMPPGKFYLMKYNCRAGSDFLGGKVAITPGVNAQGAAYLGYVACKPETERLPAKGGTATLTKK